MPMKSPQAAIVRKIATNAVQKVFGELLPEQEEAELVTSVVRQWLTHEGHAVLRKETNAFYLTLRQQGAGYEMTLDQVPGDVLDRFLVDWQIDREHVPEILHRLNVGQSAEVTNRKGRLLRFSVNPKERTTSIEDTGPSPVFEKPAAFPLLCPHCSGVLGPWQSGQAEQRCPVCKRTVQP